MLTDKQRAFLAKAQDYEALSDELDLFREELQKAMQDLGVDTYTQDPITLAVYKIIEPTGTFVHFPKIGYKRTNMEGEKNGGPTVLSKKEAEEAGFQLKR